MNARARLRLAPGRDKALRQGHPWLFSGAVAEESGPRDAPLADLEAADGSQLGVGFYSPASQIRARLVRRDPGPVDRALFAERLRAAIALRDAVLPPSTTGYRLLNAEGDGIPGWTVDRFGEVLVSQITVAGLERLKGEAYAALAEVVPATVVVQANGVRARREEGLPQGDEAIAGEAPAEAAFLEDGLRFTAELGGGQKTGFYCDQRESRRLAGRLAAGRSLLDLFAHSAAFTVHALRGGATRATAVESAPRLLARGRAHLASNDLDGELVSWVKANVFDYLRDGDAGAFDLVVCDPPPLVKSRGALDAGARAYKDLNRLALRRVAPGGFLLTFTCSAAVDAKLFRQILFSAAEEAGVEAQLLAPLSAAPDHPVAITHPQGEYLKGWWLRVGR